MLLVEKEARLQKITFYFFRADELGLSAETLKKVNAGFLQVLGDQAKE